MKPKWKAAQKKFREVAAPVGEEVKKFTNHAKPYLYHAAAASAAYTVVLTSAQYVGYLCRISNATPVLATLGGIIGVGAASAAAGQASLQVQHYLHNVKPRRNSKLQWISGQKEDIALDILIGVALFKLLGGKYRNVMPSDLFYPGSMAVESVAAINGPKYADMIQKREVGRINRRYGCHSCGAKRKEFICDHQPPSGRLEPSMQIIGAADQFGFGQVLRKVFDSLQIKIPPPPQRFFPHCRNCSQKQAVAVRNKRRVLVMHFGGMKPYHFAGLLVGMPYYSPKRIEQRRGWLL